jgi:hypothetical protein
MNWVFFFFVSELGLSICMKLCDGGFVGEVRQGSERVGFEVVTLDGRRGRLASTTISRSPLSFHFSLLGHISLLNVMILYTKTHISNLFWKNIFKFGIFSIVIPCNWLIVLLLPISRASRT